MWRHVNGNILFYMYPSFFITILIGLFLGLVKCLNDLQGILLMYLGTARIILKGVHLHLPLLLANVKFIIIRSLPKKMLLTYKLTDGN